MFKFLTYPKRLNELFCDAVNIWLLLEDEDALEISVNAYLIAAEKQRASMYAYASTSFDTILTAMQMSGIFSSSTQPDLGDPSALEGRLSLLLEKFKKEESMSLLQARKAMKPENEKAVATGDALFFRSRYPDFILWE